jgi:DNA-binding LacI/PurR family transcriptional regulator
MVEVGRQLAKLAIAQIESEDPQTHEVAVPTVFARRSTCRPLRKEEHMLL